MCNGVVVPRRSTSRNMLPYFLSGTVPITHNGAVAPPHYYTWAKGPSNYSPYILMGISLPTYFIYQKFL